MTNGSPPIVSFSAVEKNLTYVGYAAMVLTTTLLSMTSGRSPARCAETAAARPHGPPPTITRSASFDIALGSGDDGGTDWERALDPDDLVAASPDAHVCDLCFDERLDTIEVATRLGRQIRQRS